MSGLQGNDARIVRDAEPVFTGRTSTNPPDHVPCLPTLGVRSSLSSYLALTCIAPLCIESRMNLNKSLVAASVTPLVLAVLTERDSYGYAIIKRVAELSGGHLQWTDGMLYPVLHRLERQGLITAKWGQSEHGRQAQVLSHHQAGPSTARGRAETMARRRSDAEGPLDEARASHDDSRRARLARNADCPVARVRAPPTGYPRRRHRGTGGSFTGRGDRPHGMRPRGRRGLPRRSQAHGEPRRRIARVRKRALRAFMETAGHVTRGRRAAAGSGPHRGARRHGPRIRRCIGRQAPRILLASAIQRATQGFFVRNASLFVLPSAHGIFPVEARDFDRGSRLVGAGVSWPPPYSSNAFPFTPGSDTQVLTAVHLPIALWLLVGIAYVGEPWFASNRRMDFVRFSGELSIYYVLIALGGGVLHSVHAADLLLYRHACRMDQFQNG